MDESTNSCGTISSRSTASQSTHMDGPALLRELERLRTGLSGLLVKKLAEQRTRDDVSALAGERLLVLSCLAKGVSLEDWRTLAAEFEDMEQWYAFELDPARNPQLAAASTKGVSLQQTVCPETGLLLAAYFQKHLCAELEKARKTGNGPTLLLLEIVNGASRLEPRPTPRREPTLSQIFSGNVDLDTVAEPVTPAQPTEAVALTLDDQKKLLLLAQTLRAHARGCDVPARMDSVLALLMPGAGALRARAFAERLILAFDEALRRVSGGQPVRLALRAGIAGCEIDDIPDDATLITRAKEALGLAQPGGTRTYRKNDMGASERKTQVQACEKQFLFFGAAESR